MSARLLDVKDAIQQYHVDHPKNYSGPKLSDSDWEKIAKFVSVLGVLAEATQYVGSEQYATCSDVLPLASFFRRLLLKVHDDDPGYISRFKTASLNDCTRRVEGFDALPTLQMGHNIRPQGLRSTLQEAHMSGKRETQSSVDCSVQCNQGLL